MAAIYVAKKFLLCNNTRQILTIWEKGRLRQKLFTRKGKGKGGKGGRNDEGTCVIEPEDLDAMMAIGEGCYEECYGDFMTTGGGDYGTAVGRNDYDYSMGLVEFAEVLTSLL